MGLESDEEGEQDRGRFAGRRESGERQDATAPLNTPSSSHTVCFSAIEPKKVSEDRQGHGPPSCRTGRAAARFRVGNERLHSLSSSFEQNQARNCFFLRGPFALVRRTRRCAARR